MGTRARASAISRTTTSLRGDAQLYDNAEMPELSEFLQFWLNGRYQTNWDGKSLKVTLDYRKMPHSEDGYFTPSIYDIRALVNPGNEYPLTLSYPEEEPLWTITHRDAEECMAQTLGHELFHYLHDTEQIIRPDTEIDADAFGIEFLNRFKAWRELKDDQSKEGKILRLAHEVRDQVLISPSMWSSHYHSAGKCDTASDSVAMHLKNNGVKNVYRVDGLFNKDFKKRKDMGFYTGPDVRTALMFGLENMESGNTHSWGGGRR